MANDRIEVKLARRVVERYRLTPPISNLDVIISHYANLVEEELPVSADGATLYKAGEKPTILINSGRNLSRTRFTKAHELGHVLLPSHVGDILDPKIDPSNEHDSREREANTFAAELLMPDEWMKVEFSAKINPILLVKKVQHECQVSFLSATIRSIDYMPPGMAYALVNHNGTVIHSGRSNYTFTSQPYRGTILEDYKHGRSAENYWQSPSVTSELSMHWWQYQRTMALPEVSADKSWQLVLEAMKSDFERAGYDFKQFKASLSGVAGAANSDLKGANITEGEIAAAILQRIRRRVGEFVGYEILVNHSNFEVFLASRAKDLHKRRNILKIE